MGKLRTQFQRLKNSLKGAHDVSQKVRSVTDRAHALMSKSYNAVGNQLEPELRQRVGGTLQGYSKRRQLIANVDANVRQIAGMLRGAFPEYLAI